MARKFTLFFLAGLAFVILLASFVPHGEEFPKNVFRSPITYPIKLTGTYGELRPNHFHSGIDIKSPNGRPGADILAAASGYVSRIKVRTGGYGNVIYMNHPNGYTTVYAHLSQFAPAIAKYVKRKQYEKESFEVDLHPPADMFRFRKGEVIGKMGNTGTSSGPHLHFEIRDQRTEEPLNAARFGLPIKDNVPPKLHKIKTYLLDADLHPLREKEVKLVKNAGIYFPKGNDTLLIGNEKVGLGIKAFDHMEGSNAWNGIYSLSLKVDGEEIYSFRFDRFAFSETRYVNAHLDYEDKITQNSTFHRLYHLPGNRLKIYGQKRGVISLPDYRPRQVDITVYDAAGNASKARFWLRRGPEEPVPSISFNYLFPYDQKNTVDYGGMHCEFPTNTFYQNIYFKTGMEHRDEPGTFGPVYQVHEITTPVQRYFRIALPAGDVVPQDLRPKAFIAHKDKKGRWENAGGQWKGNTLTARVRALGEYTIRVDLTPPEIRPKNFSNNMAGRRLMSFYLKDDMPTTGRARSLRYRATVDGQWILMEYRNGVLTHHFDGHIGKGSHVLRIVATDAVGNETVLEREFTR